MYSGKLTRMYSGELDNSGWGRAAHRHLLLSPDSAVRGLPGGIFADNYLQRPDKLNSFCFFADYVYICSPFPWKERTF